jgi:hypothetical protein
VRARRVGSGQWISLRPALYSNVLDGEVLYSDEPYWDALSNDRGDKRDARCRSGEAHARAVQCGIERGHQVGDCRALHGLHVDAAARFGE